MTVISPENAKRLEDHRNKTNGQFGEQHLQDAGSVVLSATAVSETVVAEDITPGDVVWIHGNPIQVIGVQPELFGDIDITDSNGRSVTICADRAVWRAAGPIASFDDAEWTDHAGDLEANWDNVQVRYNADGLGQVRATLKGNQTYNSHALGYLNSLTRWDLIDLGYDEADADDELRLIQQLDTDPDSYYGDWVTKVAAPAIDAGMAERYGWKPGNGQVGYPGNATVCPVVVATADHVGDLSDADIDNMLFEQWLRFDKEARPNGVVGAYPYRDWIARAVQADGNMPLR